VGEGDSQVVERFDHAVPALGEGDTEASEVFGLGSPADAELDPPLSAKIA